MFSSAPQEARGPAMIEGCEYALHPDLSATHQHYAGIRIHEFMVETLEGHIEVAARPAFEHYTMHINAAQPKSLVLGFKTAAGEVVFEKEISDPLFRTHAKIYCGAVAEYVAKVNHGTSDEMNAADMARTKAHDKGAHYVKDKLAPEIKIEPRRAHALFALFAFMSAVP